MRRVPRLAVMLLATALASCSDATEPDAPLDCEPSQAVDVTVQLARRPAFTWTPGCGMASLSVTGPTGSGWELYSGAEAAQNPIGSGVRYGDAPTGTLEPSPAQPLQTGSEYTVAVYRWIGEPGGPGSLFQRGSATFIAP